MAIDLEPIKQLRADAISRPNIDIEHPYVRELLSAAPALVAEIEASRLTIAQQEAELQRLREALEFYSTGIGHTELTDNGAIARAALQGQSND